MKIFVQDATLLDCAVFLPQQGPVGRSWSVDVYWTGEQDETGMLFDFALAKRMAKQTIDHEFDHKLLVKSSQIRHQSHSQIIVAGSFIENEKEQFFALNTYNSSIKKISRETLKALELGDVTLLEQDIAQDILRNSPKNIQKVEVKLKAAPLAQSANYFHYTHSLCSHVGNCQRFHGHSSFVEVYENKVFQEAKSKYLANHLRNKYIISRSYIQANWNFQLIQEIKSYCEEVESLGDSLYALQYSGTQGQIGLLVSKEKVISLDVESTIENLARFVASQCGDDPNLEIRAFEGLCKGAVFQAPSK